MKKLFVFAVIFSLFSTIVVSQARADVVLEWETERVMTSIGSYVAVEVTPLNSPQIIKTITQIDITTETPYTYIASDEDRSATGTIIYIPNSTTIKIEEVRRHIFSGNWGGTHLYIWKGYSQLKKWVINLYIIPLQQMSKKKFLKLNLNRLKKSASRLLK